MTKFNKILIVGCSFSNGSGLPGEHNNSRIWANQLTAKLGACTINNVSRTGANNHWIFLETISALIKDRYDLVLVEWSAIPRYRFKVGLELYSVDSLLDRDVNLVRHETITKKWLSEIKNRLLRIHNDHWDILDLIKYVNTLIELQTKLYQGKIFFINGLGPWPNQYFAKKQIYLPSDLDAYTHNLLQATDRNDKEIFQLYNMIHDQYASFGGIQEKYWLNLYQSQSTLMIDVVSTVDHHPGYLSQDLFADYFYQQIQEKLNIK
tara:strand:+ start:94 stop:885 length:792 start_codon:yes stop_codon:yes gene_type:complete